MSGPPRSPVASARALVLAFSLALGPTSASAQGSTADLSGAITDATGATLAGVTVVATNRETGTIRRTTADGVGRYHLPALAPGEYTISSRADGFGPVQRPVRLTVGEHAVLDLTLDVLGRTEQVQVIGDRAPRETSALGGFVDRSQVLELPVSSRSYEQLVLMTPGVSGPTTRTGTVVYQHGLKININGASSRSNLFLLDGTNVGDLYNNGVGSAAGTFLGIEAVREFRVMTNAYPAAYGGVGGGIVSIVTRSGSNTAHGSAFEFLRDDALDARNFFDAIRPDLVRHQFGASAGGAAIKDRVFYFVSAEAVVERLGLTQVTTVPSNQAREGRLPDPRSPGALVTPSPAMTPFLNLFPLPNGADFGGGLAGHSFSASRDTNQGLGQVRVDVPLRSGNNAFARFTYDRAARFDPGSYPNLGTDWRSTGRFLTVEDTQTLGASATNVSRFSYSSTAIGQVDRTLGLVSPDLSVIAGRPVPMLVVGGMPPFGSLVSPKTQADQRLFAWADEAALAKGPHLFKWGALLERYRALAGYQLFWGGRATFADVARFLQASPTSLVIALPGADGVRDLTTTQFALYAQDEVRVGSTLTLNGGVRWEFSTDPRDALGRLAGLRDPVRDAALTSGTLLKTRKRNIEPRVGFAWRPGANGSTVVRGGFGVFYDINTLPYVWLAAGTNPPYFTQVTLVSPRFPEPAFPARIVPTVAVPQFDWATPGMNHFNLAVDHELAPGTLLRAAYAGSRGFNVVRTGDINAPVSQVLADGTVFFPPGAPRQNSNFGGIAYRAPNGRSWYDALQLSAERRAGSLRLQAAYTRSRAVDQTQGIVPTESNGSVTEWMDPFNPTTDKGPADFDRRHNLIVNVIWDLPAASTMGAVSSLTRGWSLASILTVRSGMPFTVGIQNDYSRTLSRVSVDRPNWAPGFPADQVVVGGVDHYFDPRAFQLQAPGTFGNVDRNSLVGPGMATLDLSVSRRLSTPMFGRSTTLQLRIEAFNVLNRANFDVPQRIVFAGASPNESPLSTAGRITATTTSARQVQLGGKLTW